jgi:hypothetical protein
MIHPNRTGSKEGKKVQQSFIGPRIVDIRTVTLLQINDEIESIRQHMAIERSMDFRRLNDHWILCCWLFVSLPRHESP